MKELKELYDEITGCKNCPVSAWPDGKKEVGWGVPGRILFIGQSPAHQSFTFDEGESPFDIMFMGMLADAGIYKDDFFFTNFCKVPPAKPIYSLTDKEERHCGKHLEDEIFAIQPSIIVSLGVMATRWLSQQKYHNRFFLTHPSALRYGKPTYEQYGKKLLEIRDAYEKTKVENITNQTIIA